MQIKISKACETRGCKESESEALSSLCVGRYLVKLKQKRSVGDSPF